MFTRRSGRKTHHRSTATAPSEGQQRVQKAIDANHRKNDDEFTEALEAWKQRTAGRD